MRYFPLFSLLFYWNDVTLLWGCKSLVITPSWAETETKLQDWRKSDSPLSDEETVSASDLSMEKAEALMMFDTGKEKEVDEAGQNEINTELGREILVRQCLMFISIRERGSDDHQEPGGDTGGGTTSTKVLLHEISLQEQSFPQPGRHPTHRMYEREGVI